MALVVWASAFAGIQAGLRSYGPGELALLRFGTASAVLGVYAASKRMRLPRAGDLGILALAGLLGITGYHLLLNFGEQTVSAGAASILIATGPIFTAVMATAFLRERLTVLGWVGVALAFSGDAVIALKAGGGLRLEPAALLVLGAAVCTAAYFVVGKQPLRHYTALEFTTYAVWLGTLPMLAFLPGFLRQLPRATTSSTLTVLYLGVFPGALAYVLWSYALARLPASLCASFLYFQPVVAMIIAFAWIREVPSAQALVGGAISIAGVVLLGTLGRVAEAAPTEVGEAAPLPSDASALLADEEPEFDGA